MIRGCKSQQTKEKQMYTFIVIALTVLITSSSFGYGYWLANKHRELSDKDFFRNLTYDDFLSDTPIAHKLDREYGFDN
jgi:hypothetical protein